MILKPIEQEKWIEKYRRRDFWIARRRKYKQRFYARLCNSYVGWWLHLRLRYAGFQRLSLLIDPSSTGGLRSHIHCFLYNAIMVDIIWKTRHRIWKLFHKKEWDAQMRFMEACMQATEEGYADEMPAPEGFPAERFHGSYLGERYFTRVKDILTQSGSDMEAK